MKVVSLPVYVNMHHCSLVVVGCCDCGIGLVRDVQSCAVVFVCVGSFLFVGWVCKWNTLLYNMFRMMFSSFLNSSVCKFMYSGGYVGT
jgi:hypothetical protein